MASTAWVAMVRPIPARLNSSARVASSTGITTSTSKRLLGREAAPVGGHHRHAHAVGAVAHRRDHHRVARDRQLHDPRRLRRRRVAQRVAVRVAEVSGQPQRHRRAQLDRLVGDRRPPGRLVLVHDPHPHHRRVAQAARVGRPHRQRVALRRRLGVLPRSRVRDLPALPGRPRTAPWNRPRGCRSACPPPVRRWRPSPSPGPTRSDRGCRPGSPRARIRSRRRRWAGRWPGSG